MDDGAQTANARLVGQPVRRKEDRRFLTGEGRYVDDIQLPGMTYGVVLRSPHAHARITRIATDRAAALPGVLAVITAADLDAAKVGGLPCGWGVPLADGRKQAEPPHPVLAGATVRHVGDPVAFVVAETRDAALDGAEAIEIDYAPLPHITNLEQSVAAGAPQIWPEAEHNLCYDWAGGDAAATDQAVARAADVTTVKLINNRVHASPMETRGAIGH